MQFICTKNVYIHSDVLVSAIDEHDSWRNHQQVATVMVAITRITAVTHIKSYSPGGANVTRT